MAARTRAGDRRRRDRLADDVPPAPGRRRGLDRVARARERPRRAVRRELRLDTGDRAFRRGQFRSRGRSSRERPADGAGAGSPPPERSRVHPRDRPERADGRSGRPDARRRPDPREPRPVRERQRAAPRLAGGGRRSRPGARALARSPGPIRQAPSRARPLPGSVRAPGRQGDARAFRRLAQVESPAASSARRASASSTSPAKPLTPTAPILVSPSNAASPPRKNVKNGSKLARSTASSRAFAASSLVERASLRAAVYALRCAFSRVSGAAPSIVAAATSSPCESATKTETGPDASRTTKSTTAWASASFTARL